PTAVDTPAINRYILINDYHRKRNSSEGVVAVGTLSRWRRWWTALLFALVVSGKSIAAPVEAAAIPVVVTIHPLSSIVKAVGGPLVRVETLLPPGASPHTFEPRPAHVRAVAEAQLVVAVGAGLDDWVLAIARSAKDAGILLASE